jgi:glucose/arabinose dehydrogenase
MRVTGQMTGPRLPAVHPSIGRPLAVLLAGLLAFVTLVPGASASTPDWSKADPVAVVEDIEMPTDIQVAPDGAIWFLELEGDVSRFDPKTGETTLMHHVEDVVTGGERGLVGLALAKDFSSSGTYFLYYTKRTDDPDGGLNHLVRVDDGKETVLLTVSGWKEHNGGRIVIDGDGNLFVGVGENQKRDPAQDLDSNLGKILHLKPDGSAAPGNMQGLVYAKGIRNPFGLAINPTTKELWETENSGWRRDEINIIKPGGNYGYPECEGNNLNGLPGPADQNPCPTNKGYTFPLRTFYETDAVAPTGAAFWRGEFYWGSLNEGSIHHLWQDPDSKEWFDEKVLEGQSPVLDIAVGPDDALYFSTTDGIMRIELANIDVGNSGEDGQAQVTGSDGGGNRINRPTATDEADEKGASGVPFVVLVVAVGVGMMVRRKQS